MPKIKETLRSISFYKIDRSTQRLSTGRITLQILAHFPN